MECTIGTSVASNFGRSLGGELTCLSMISRKSIASEESGWIVYGVFGVALRQMRISCTISSHGSASAGGLVASSSAGTLGAISWVVVAIDAGGRSARRCLRVLRFFLVGDLESMPWFAFWFLVFSRL
jgi:hypothetical protein